jgi:hypothetical protein
MCAQTSGFFKYPNRAAVRATTRRVSAEIRGSFRNALETVA